jgi:cysteine synthase B
VRARLAEDLLAGIGGTPLVELEGFAADAKVRIFAKVESVNPGGSIKDRPVARMIRRAIAEHRFADGRRLLDSSSGNAGIAYAMLGAAFGVPVTLVVPANASRERQDRMRAHGAELRLTDPIEGYDFALRTAHRLARERPDLYWHCDQYANPENWRAHYETTGREILEDLRALELGPPDAFVAGVGTGGTITGVGRRLREARADVRIAAIVPEIFPGIEGLKPLGQPGDIVPAILDESLIDERIPVTTERAAAGARALAARGLFVGPSSGGYLHAALEIARRGDARTIVTILNDTGERYGSTGLWANGGAANP